MAHSDTKVKINDDTEPPCYRPFQKANTSHSCLPGIHSRQGRCQASTQNMKQKEKQPFVWIILWFIYFT